MSLMSLSLQNWEKKKQDYILQQKSLDSSLITVTARFMNNLAGEFATYKVSPEVWQRAWFAAGGAVFSTGIQYFRIQL